MDNRFSMKLPIIVNKFIPKNDSPIKTSRITMIVWFLMPSVESGVDSMVGIEGIFGKNPVLGCVSSIACAYILYIIRDIDSSAQVRSKQINILNR